MQQQYKFNERIIHTNSTTSSSRFLYLFSVSFYYTTQYTTSKKKGLGNMYSIIVQECLVCNTGKL